MLLFFFYHCVTVAVLCLLLLVDCEGRITCKPHGISVFSLNVMDYDERARFYWYSGHAMLHANSRCPRHLRFIYGKCLQCYWA